MEIINLNDKIIISKWFTLIDLGHLLIHYQCSEDIRLTISWCMGYYSNKKSPWWFIKITKSGIIIDKT